jgi:predicted nucleotidyltransferase
MPSLAQASLTSSERRTLDRFVARVRGEYGDELRSVWLFGSRARGEEPKPQSDVDVLVVLRGATLDDHFRTARLMYEAAEAEGANPVLFSVSVYTPERVAQRREIRSFFIQDVDRDKIVLAGEA